MIRSLKNIKSYQQGRTVDLYGFTQGHYNPWMACNYSQLNSLYFNMNNEYFEQAQRQLLLYGCERMSNFFEKASIIDYLLQFQMPSLKLHT